MRRGASSVIALCSSLVFPASLSADFNVGLLTGDRREIGSGYKTPTPPPAGARRIHPTNSRARTAATTDASQYPDRHLVSSLEPDGRSGGQARAGDTAAVQSSTFFLA
ncbi:hypothetical protein GGTG_02702 [Gaeumannomyces tritici R3-111a-1]|uniref:Uncharacterized protein n=1 Tax=Gaeumannomyces tritici (strain R3-111a-1) TaxID=644352 RepID=J3NN44_GAET3|nr:hypothetical protein GGTG_02702 [Gaeumannomyces tritici R3-111a-1]EJT77596.1 hypothetical protein GGTG_02702 [Gaeumannomyces tritici R3-111a-1]